MWDEIFQQAAQKGSRTGTLPRATPQLLCELWPALVGEQLARVSEPTRYAARTLSIATRSDALAEEWRRRPSLLLRKLQRFSPWPIEALEIRTDPGAGIRKPKPEKPDRDDDKPDADDDKLSQAAAAAEEIDGIDDELQLLIASIDRLRRQDGH